MKMPLIFDENGDISLYWSVQDAQRGIEVIDVKNGEYVAYDAAGRLLSLDTSNLGAIDIRCIESESLHTDEVLVALKRYLEARVKDLDFQNMKLLELLQIIADRNLGN